MNEKIFSEFARQAVKWWYILNRFQDPSEIYIVWESKVLQNNKAMLSTNVPDHMYFEVTYNGDKNELYFDAYHKEMNQAFDVNILGLSLHPKEEN